jgi:GNAT superfamily N-acetyltransferase
MVDLLLVEPPVSHPAALSGACRTAALQLRQVGVRTELLHAGRDYLDYLLTPEILRNLSDRAHRRSTPGARDHDPHADVPAFETLNEKLLFDGQVYTPERLFSDDLADPFTAVKILQRIDMTFALVTHAYAPAVVDRRSFGDPTLQRAVDLAEWLEDNARNPFREYALARCVTCDPPARCERIIFVIRTPGQIAGALSMAKVWHDRMPAAIMALCAADARQEAVAHQILGLDTQRHPAYFDNWLQKVRKVLNETTASESDPAMDGPWQGKTPMAAPPLFARLAPESMQALLDGLPQGQSRTLIWQDPAGALPEITAQLYRATKAGCWNHLVLPDTPEQPLIEALIRFASANPNIIHSWCRTRAPLSGFSDVRTLYPSGNPAYGATRPLPGMPVWQKLQDPLYLDAYVARLGAKTLARMYLLEDDRLHEVGSQMTFSFVPPAQLPPGHLDEIVRMVEAGGSVQTQWVRHNLERAFLIGYVEENGVIVGNSSLKHPRKEYIEAVSAQSGLDLSNYLERGYTSVRPEYRSLGVGARLLAGLTQRAGDYKIFSIIAEDNVATQKMAIRNRTRRVATFYSERSRKTMSVWIPEEMLDDE